MRCVFIQDNPAYDGLRASLGLRAAAGAAPPPPRGVLCAAEVGTQVRSSFEVIAVQQVQCMYGVESMRHGA